MSEEKRKFTRFPFKMKATLSVDNIIYNINEIENLSIGGCLLKLQEDFDPGKKCRLEIILGITGNEPKVNINGRIMRCDKENIAIKFTRIDPNSLHHLQSIARFNASDPDTIESELKKHPGLF